MIDDAQIDLAIAEVNRQGALARHPGRTAMLAVAAAVGGGWWLSVVLPPPYAWAPTQADARARLVRSTYDVDDDCEACKL